MRNVDWNKCVLYEEIVKCGMILVICVNKDNVIGCLMFWVLYDFLNFVNNFLIKKDFVVFC